MSNKGSCEGAVCLFIMYAVAISGITVCTIGLAADPIDGECVRPGAECTKSDDCPACITPDLRCTDFQIGPSGAWCGENATFSRFCDKCTCYSIRDGFACGTAKQHAAPHKPLYIGFLVVSILILLVAVWATFMTWFCSMFRF